MDERRSEQRDAMREGVSALHADLLALREGDRELPQLRKAVAALAAQARANESERIIEGNER